MKLKMFYLAPLAALMLSACVVVPTHRGHELAVAPVLPVVIDLGVNPYYQQSGYYYWYNNNSWSYSNSRSGPWTSLPLDRYPRETRYNGRSERHDGGRGDHDRRY